MKTDLELQQDIIDALGFELGKEAAKSAWQLLSTVVTVKEFEDLTEQVECIKDTGGKVNIPIDIVNRMVMQLKREYV